MIYETLNIGRDFDNKYIELSLTNSVVSLLDDSSPASEEQLRELHIRVR